MPHTTLPPDESLDRVPVRDGIRLRDGGRDVWLVPWTHRPRRQEPRNGDAGDQRDGPGEVWWTEHPATVLHRLASDAYNIEQLRRLLGQTHWLGSTERLPDHEVVDRIRREVESGWLVFADLRHRERDTATTSAATPHPKRPAAAPPPEPVRERAPRRVVEKAWIRIVFLRDADDRPVPGINLTVSFGDGTEEEVVTDIKGRVERRGIDSRACAVRCDIADARLSGTWIVVGEGGSADDGGARQDRGTEAGKASVAEVDEVHVKSGDTLDGVAKTHGMTWRELARFNWGTDVPAQINDHLRDDVGCTRTTRDGKNYVFHEGDNPGILFVPHEWKSTGLATNREHVFRLRRAGGIIIVLENEEGLRIPEAEYEATFADESVRQGILGRNGMAYIRDPATGEFRVIYREEDDVLAKSLAASVRKGFDDRMTHQLFRMLAYGTSIVSRAHAAYDRYFNDYTGRGLVEDIYQELTDPQALGICEALMAHHGMPTRTALVVVGAESDDDEQQHG